MLQRLQNIMTSFRPERNNLNVCVKRNNFSKQKESEHLKAANLSMLERL